MFGFGIVMALLGAVLPVLAQTLHFNLARTGELFLVMNAGMLVTTLALGPLVDRFGHKLPLLIAPLFVAGALSLVPKVRTFAELMAAVLLLGIGGGALNQAANTLIADLYPDARAKGAALNVLGVFFGFGALFVPFSIGSGLRTLGLGPILLLAAGLGLLPIVLSPLHSRFRGSARVYHGSRCCGYCGNRSYSRFRFCCSLNPATNSFSADTSQPISREICGPRCRSRPIY
jgi:MFS family permease